MKDIFIFKSPKPSPWHYVFTRFYRIIHTISVELHGIHKHNFTHSRGISGKACIITHFSANCSYGHVNSVMQTKLLVQIGRDKSQVMWENRASSSFGKVTSNFCANNDPSCGQVSLRGLAGALYARIMTVACALQHSCWSARTRTCTHVHANARTHTHTLLHMHVYARTCAHARPPPRAHTK